MKPTLYLLVGIPGSGKSLYSRTLSAVIHSSDALREELFSDVNFQDKNTELFFELHRRIKADLAAH